MKQRNKFRLGAAALALVMMAGCNAAPAASSSSQADGSSTAASSQAAPKKEITLIGAAKQDWIKDIDRQLAESFKAETGITIEFQVVPNDQYDNVIKAKLASGEGPDFFYGDSGLALKKYFPEKYCADLSSEEWAARYTESAKLGCSVDGTIYALNCWASDPWGIMYDEQLFNKLNIKVPTNYDEFLAACETLKQNGVIPLYENGKDTWHIPGFFKNSGAIVEVNNPGAFEKINKGEAKFADYPEFEQMMANLKGLYDKGYFASDMLSETWGKHEEAMASGKYGMMLVWTSFGNEIVAKFPEAGPVDRWKMFGNPMFGDLSAVEVSLGGIVRMANKDSKNLDAVKQYFAWCADAKNLQTYYDARPDLAAIKPFAELSAMPTNPALESYVARGTAGERLCVESCVEHINGDLVAKGMQELFLGLKTPAQVIESIDADRAKTLETINKN